MTLITSTSEPITALDNDITTLRAQLEQAEQRKAAVLQEETAKREQARRDTIKTLPSLLGVQTLAEVIPLLKHELGGAAVKATKGFSNALSKETLAQMKTMLVAHSTSRATAEALGCGISTVDLYKRRWGLTNRTSKGKRSPQARNNHLSPEKRARIERALNVANPNIAQIARRETTSRQTIYAIRDKLAA